jgi:hypothetical protein
VPAWLSSWAPLPERIWTKAGAHRLFRKEYPVGTVALGGSHDAAQPAPAAMYGVWIQPQSRKSSAAGWLGYPRQ